MRMRPTPPSPNRNTTASVRLPSTIDHIAVTIDCIATVNQSLTMIVSPSTTNPRPRTYHRGILTGILEPPPSHTMAHHLVSHRCGEIRRIDPWHQISSNLRRSIPATARSLQIILSVRGEHVECTGERHCWCLVSSVYCGLPFTSHDIGCVIFR
jgi:hypothetical protein